MEAKIKPFYVIIYNFNGKRFEKYDVMETLVDDYKSQRKKPTDLEKFVKSTAMYHWWAKCEYEMILSDWPSSGVKEKWDIYQQLMMNFDLVVELFKENIEAITPKPRKKQNQNIEA